MEGKVVAINISEKKKTPKKTINPGTLIENFGFEGDAHAGSWHRQVSLLAKESIEKSKGMRTDGICHGIFAENLTTEGIKLHALPVGTKLAVGDCVIEITQIGKECHDGCAIKELVGQCIMPKEGIFAKVIKGGKVYQGDIIEVID
ncbi:MAG: MOSC domain-containing protein [Clostridia bacterium]|nr:MOSC domain-containing protein [Clostridia bacterium]